MSLSVALLRGINVSGKNLISMKDLEGLFLSAGMKNVTTYIQSGNVVFEHSKVSGKELEETLEKAISKKFGFDVPVIVRAASDISKVIKSMPFPASEERMLYITFLKGLPAVDLSEQLSRVLTDGDSIQITGKHVYLQINNGYGNTKLSNNFIEKQLRVTATTRNLKTVKKLKELTGL